MHLKAVHVRFFKSFNFDFLRKNHPHAKAKPWEMIDGAWFPFVRVPLTPDITTVVGANESGKSHLLAAIEKGLSGEGISRRDFCRYSQFFTVEEGRMRWPDFGLHFAGLTGTEKDQLRELAGVKPGVTLDEFVLIRTERARLEVWVPNGEEYTNYPVSDAGAFLKSTLLPAIFHIDSSVALPSSVPISWLRGATNKRWDREKRTELLATVERLLPSLSSEDSIKRSAGEVQKGFAPFSTLSSTPNGKAGSRAERECQLARDLLFKVARIDPAAVKDLSEALAKSDEGLANGILQQMNTRLGAALNFPRWWVQDRDFQLVVSARDDDLVFAIRDRTQTEYSFGERSNGLKYFLSYYIQYLAHAPEAARNEILLMDEPDAYLSSQGQQDLLKIFNSFAHPDDGRKPVQVVYVTHSPFLIDRNHGERIRVLEKGTDDEGTRVVNDAAKNQYEPLRSSFGAFVGETTFIGNCNLMVEGLADQIFLAGCATYLRAAGAPRMNTLDLNRVTVVPAGSASHIPYLVYLARGRDVEQPSVIVMLDSDASGKDAHKGLQRGGPNRKQLLKPEYVLQLGSLAEAKLPEGRKLVEIEDLVPPGIAAVASRRYLQTVCGKSSSEAEKVTAEGVLSHWTGETTQFDAVNAVVVALWGDDAHIDKMGFARAVVELVQEALAGEAVLPVADKEVFDHNVGKLLARLASMQRQAERDSAQERISRRLDRAVKSFLRDHPNGCRREDAMVLLEYVESVLDDSQEADHVRLQVQALRRDFNLSEPSSGTVSSYTEFAERLRQVRYAAVNAVQKEGLDLYNRSPAVETVEAAPPTDVVSESAVA